MAGTSSPKQSQGPTVFRILVETLPGLPLVECSDALYAIPLVVDSALPRMVEYGVASCLP